MNPKQESQPLKNMQTTVNNFFTARNFCMPNLAAAPPRSNAAFKTVHAWLQCPSATPVAVARQAKMKRCRKWQIRQQSPLVFSRT